MTTSIDAEKALHKIQLPFMIKTLRKRGIEGNFNLIKSIYQAPKANDRQLNTFSKVGNKPRMSVLTALIQHSAGSSSQWHEARKEIKGTQLERKKIIPICR